MLKKPDNRKILYSEIGREHLFHVSSVLAAGFKECPEKYGIIDKLGLFREMFPVTSNDKTQILKSQAKQLKKGRFR